MLERHRDVLAYLPIGICHIINSSYVSQVVAQTQAPATYGEVRKTQSSIIPLTHLHVARCVAKIPKSSLVAAWMLACDRRAGVAACSALLMPCCKTIEDRKGLRYIENVSSILESGREMW